jgi:hypothetical protein
VRPARVLNLDDTAWVIFQGRQNQGQLAMISPVPILTASLDESSDERGQLVFCAAAMVTSVPHWRSLTEGWCRRLQEDNVAFFRASSCRAVRGPFQHLRRIHGSFAAARLVAERIRADLEGLMLNAKWMGFGIGVVRKDYDEVLRMFPIARKFYAMDSAVAGYSQLMYEVVRSVRRNAKGFDVAYIFDSSNKSPKIIEAFNGMKVNHPVIGKSARTILPLDDKGNPLLQMADLLASVVRGTFIKWLRTGDTRYAPLDSKWLSHFARIGKWDKLHMLRALYKNLSSRRFQRGLLPARGHSDILAARERKKQLRAIARRMTK